MSEKENRTHKEAGLHRTSTWSISNEAGLPLPPKQVKQVDTSINLTTNADSGKLPPKQVKQVDMDKVRQAHQLYNDHQNKSKVSVDENEAATDW